MTNTLESIRHQLNHYWDSMEKRQKRNLFIIIGLIALAIIVVSLLMNQKDYIVLYSGLEEQEAAEIYTKLKELKAEPKMSGTSTILAPKDKEAELRMQMTLEGYPKSGFNYDIYLKGSAFGQTDDEMQKRWIIQLQERLSQSIRFLDGVQDAVVTIAMPKTDSFVLKQDRAPVTASVIVLPKEGAQITPIHAKSIEQLVATSVPGLAGENISIIDNRMNVLNVDTVTESELVSNQFELQQQLENKIKSEIKDLLEPVFGYGRVKIAVSARLNFDRRMKESITFEPVVDDSGIIVSQELLKEKVNSTFADGITGEASNTTQYPELSGSENTSSQKDHKKINYEVNEVKEQIEEEQGKLEELSIAVVIDNDELDLQTVNQVKELVATAMGTDMTRVAVQNWKFNTDLQDDLLETLKNRGQTPSGINTSTFIIIAGCIIFLIVILVLMRKGKYTQSEQAISEIIEEVQAPQDIEMIDFEAGEQNKVKKQLEKFAAERPEAVAQLLRNWLSED